MSASSVFYGMKKVFMIECFKFVDFTKTTLTWETSSSLAADWLECPACMMLFQLSGFITHHHYHHHHLGQVLTYTPLLSSLPTARRLQNQWLILLFAKIWRHPCKQTCHFSTAPIPHPRHPKRSTRFPSSYLPLPASPLAPARDAAVEP